MKLLLLIICGELILILMPNFGMMVRRLKTARDILSSGLLENKMIRMKSLIVRLSLLSVV